MISESRVLDGRNLHVFAGTLFLKAREGDCGWCHFTVNVTPSVLLFDYFLTGQVAFPS